MVKHTLLETYKPWYKHREGLHREGYKPWYKSKTILVPSHGEKEHNLGPKWSHPTPV